MKKIVAHVKKHHKKLKELDHKVLELIHGVELSLVLVVTIIGVALGFVMHVTNVSDDRAGQEIEALMETQEGERLADFTQTENGRKLLLKLIETKDGRAYLENVIGNFDAEHASADEARFNLEQRNSRFNLEERTSIRNTIRSRFNG